MVCVCVCQHGITAICGSIVRVYLMLGCGHRNRTLAIKHGRTDGGGRQDQVRSVPQRAFGFDGCRAFVVQLVDW